MDIIHLLPDNVANQIAAGEVIQRPSSCLKELVENALDAEATHIRIIIRDAGRTLLQVVDNGKGMSTTDARMAFERHATSKIREASDLFSLRTMGFRGEALPSICAVSQVELTTRRQEDEVGTLLEIHGSNVIRQEATSCAAGTSIKVKNLFYNVPARRRFLKTDQTEMRNILQDFYRIALVYPHVQFTLVSQDEIVMELPAGTEKQRIESIFGKSSRQTYTAGLVDIAVDTELVSIRGFVGKPESANKQSQQYFFVNGRFMRHPYFHKAVMNAYAGMLTGDASPSYFIYFDINPEAIDVNIHPTKTEIKFADEQLIFPILLATVREALGKFNITPSLDFDVEGRLEMPTRQTEEGRSMSGPNLLRDTNYNPFQATRSSYTPSNWQQLYQPDTPRSEERDVFREEDTTSDTLFESNIAINNPYQFGGKYILLPTNEGLMMINQHRAHACVLYDMCLSRMQKANGERQQLLFPDIWEVQEDEVPTVEAMQEMLEAIGFEMERLSPRSYSLSAIPAILNGQSALGLLRQILDEVLLTGTQQPTEWQQTIALSLADAAAIPYGKTLTQDEMTDLLQKLFARPSYRHMPDGKTVVAMLSNDQIGKLF